MTAAVLLLFVVTSMSDIITIVFIATEVTVCFCKLMSETRVKLFCIQHKSCAEILNAFWFVENSTVRRKACPLHNYSEYVRKVCH